MENKSCCHVGGNTETDTFKKGFLYGLLPHGFCLAFIILSVVGATSATSLLRNWMLNSYFFPLLIFLSLFFASLSSFLYLKRQNLLSFEGIKKKKKYLSVLYSSMIGVNLLFFLVIFPLMTNFRLTNNSKNVSGQSLSSAAISVDIPCSGHAPLVGEELQKIEGIESIKFSLPNRFNITFNPEIVTLEEILNLQIFSTFKAKPV
jgi:copper chaperone CopZ